MNALALLGVVLGIVLMIFVGDARVNSRKGLGVEGPAVPKRTTQLSESEDESHRSWLTFTSPLYGYSIQYPQGWQISFSPGDRNFWAPDVVIRSPDFAYGDSGEPRAGLEIAVTVYRPLQPLRSLEEWLRSQRFSVSTAQADYLLPSSLDYPARAYELRTELAGRRKLVAFLSYRDLVIAVRCVQGSEVRKCDQIFKTVISSIH